MRLLRLLLLNIIILTTTLCSFAQENNNGGRLSGNLETNANFFSRDTLIGAANTPQYDHQLFGNDVWVNLNYSNWGFDMGLRFDFFNNSNLLNPQGSYNGQGIGRWYVKKKIDKLGISAGYLYDQIGSGIIFRAFEERPLAIDNALVGARLTYDILPDWEIKAFAGKQKQQFGLFDSVIKGASVEGFIADSTTNITLAPGIGVVNRTLDDATMNLVVADIKIYYATDSTYVFVPKYNAYAFSVYNTMSFGKFNWYIEGALKTEEALENPNEDIPVNFINGKGTAIYTSLSYANKGLGISAEFKRNENFVFRTRPQEALNRGLVNFLPPLTRVNTYRLTARYNAATQFMGEQAMQLDASYAVSRKLIFNANFSRITDINDAKTLLYQEIFTEVTYKYKRKFQLIAGVQIQNYNQERYEFKPNVPLVETVTPYAEFLYKFDRKKSLRIEAQYMLTGEENGEKHDYGDWVFGLAEFTIAPHWSFTISDMFNIGPGKNSPTDSSGEKLKIHYPRIDLVYIHHANRFSLSYVKQVEGVVCTGGICRLEPAFSGVKMTVTSSF